MFKQSSGFNLEGLDGIGQREKVSNKMKTKEF